MKNTNKTKNKNKNENKNCFGFVFLSVFFILGVAAWGPWAQATPGMKKTAAAAPAAAPAAAASVSEYFFLTLNKIVFYFSYVFCNF